MCFVKPTTADVLGVWSTKLHVLGDVEYLQVAGFCT
jgi:hypothetical protein